MRPELTKVAEGRVITMHFLMGIVPRLITLIVVHPVVCHAAKELVEIIQLRAEPDFRSVILNWEYPKQGTKFYGFQVHYCELQAWGPNRCRNKIVDESAGTESFAGKKFRTYFASITSLRMATNYSFEVRPLQNRHNAHYAKDLGKTIVVPTKEFSAKANLCLPDVSEVEVSTGPYFGGRIAVESSDSSKTDNCSIGGDATSAKDTYILRIEHKICGSTVNRTSVSTFILVQETLPILTHSTRRFIVLCTFQPETLTVRAGINLPQTLLSSPSGTTPILYKGDISRSNEILGNDVQAASLKQMNDHTQYGRSFKGSDDSHYVLVAALLLTSVIGLGLTIWWMIPLNNSIYFCLKNSNSSIYSGDMGISSVYENYTNCIADNAPVSEIDFGDINNKNLLDITCDDEISNHTLTEICRFSETGMRRPIINIQPDDQSQSQPEA